MPIPVCGSRQNVGPLLRKRQSSFELAVRTLRGRGRTLPAEMEPLAHKCHSLHEHGNGSFDTIDEVLRRGLHPGIGIALWVSPTPEKKNFGTLIQINSLFCELTKINPSSQPRQIRDAMMDMLVREFHQPELPAVCRSCEARHGGICSVLQPFQLAELSKHSSRRRIEAGSEFIGQGENVSSYSNILKGVVKLSKVMADGRQQIVGLQFAPDFMGRPFLGESLMAAEAATDTEICVFPRRAMERLIAETPELEHHLHNQALKELDEARDWMLTLGRKTAQEKVASFLSLIARNGDPESNDHSVFELPLSRADIADFLGLTIETVSRQMTKLRKEGIIQIENNRHVTVPDPGRLAAAAGND